MANTITSASKYVPLLDAKYALEAKTSILDTDNELVKQSTLDAGTVYVPSFTLQGLGDYDRDSATGFVSGNTTLSWAAHTFTQDRGRSFTIDRMDNLETAGVAFGKLAGEFIRTKVAPELDAYRMSVLYSNAGTLVAATPTSGTILDLIDTGIATLDDAEVPESDRILFISVNSYNLLKQSSDFEKRFDLQSEKGVINRNVAYLDNLRVVKMPSTRMYTAINSLDGSSGGETAGGYTQSGSADLNFVIVWKGAVVQIVKTATPRIFSPEQNQSADGWKFDYRIYHDSWVPANKQDGIYVHYQA